MTALPAGVVLGLIRVVVQEFAKRGTVPVLDVQALETELTARVLAIAEASIADARLLEPVPQPPLQRP